MEPDSQAPFSAKLLKSPPSKPKNLDCRSREYLSQSEVDLLRKTARSKGRHGVFVPLNTSSQKLLFSKK